jgi:hypothetical protein
MADEPGAGIMGGAFQPFRWREGGATISSSLDAKADEPKTRSPVAFVGDFAVDAVAGAVLADTGPAD